METTRKTIVVEIPVLVDAGYDTAYLKQEIAILIDSAIDDANRRNAAFAAGEPGYTLQPDVVVWETRADYRADADDVEREHGPIPVNAGLWDSINETGEIS